MRFDDLAITLRRRARLTAMSATRTPVMLFISCSDPRIVPTALTGAGPGEICELRTLGHRVPAYTRIAGAEAATIEHAVRGLGVGHIVVCGHSLCDILDLATEPDDRALAARGWMAAQHEESVPEDDLRDRVGRAPLPLRPDYGPDGMRFVGPRSVRRSATRHQPAYAHVLHQLGTLRTHPAVAEALEQERLALHGWFYDLVEGSVSAYEPGSATFVPL